MSYVGEQVCCFLWTFLSVNAWHFFAVCSFPISAYCISQFSFITYQLTYYVVLSNYKKEDILYPLHYILGRRPTTLLIRGSCKTLFLSTLDQIHKALSRLGFLLPLLHLAHLVIELHRLYMSHIFSYAIIRLSPLLSWLLSPKKLIFFPNTALRIHFSHSPTVGTKHEPFIAVNNYH